MLVDTSLKSQFAKDGYVAIKGLFTEDEVLSFKEAAAEIVARKGAGRVGVLVGMAAESPVFKSAAAHPRLVAALNEIIGSHVVFLSDKIVFKDSTTDFGSPWHQDYPYWFGSNKFSAWIALDDATPENGCLKVVRGSHLLGEIKHDGDASDGLGFDNRLNPEDVGSEDVVELTASRGDAIIFHDLLLHSSHPNTSGNDRWALISTYKDGTLEDPEYEWSVAAFTVSE